MKIKSSITQFNIESITSKTGNIYKSVKVIGKRARQLSAVQKEELNEKLAEFASDIDNLEEIFENKEQIEISDILKDYQNLQLLLLKNSLMMSFFLEILRIKMILFQINRNYSLI
jgi:DNA-directed RNA polymerase subunit K/omega